MTVWDRLAYEPFALPDRLVPLLHAYLRSFGLVFAGVLAGWAP